ncbi:MAG TPA: LacI family DNA-binding transcriptional regulator [Microbacteriaceae bacterium]
MPVSIRDVAVLAGVSVGTVSNVLNRPQKVADSTVTRVRDAIRTLGFIRNDAARQLRAGRSRSIGLVVLDAGNPFFMDVARGAESRALDDGLVVLLGNSDEHRSREEAYLDLFEQQRVAGLLITPIDDALPRLQRMREQGIPCVLVDRQVHDKSFSSVAVDNTAGGRMAVNHLIDSGRRKIAFIGGPRGLAQVDERLAGARQAVHESPGVTLELIETEFLTVLQGRAAGEAIGLRAAANRPNAIFAANDLVAVGVLQGLAILGDIRVPEDIALIGYDDIEFAASTIVPLTSIRQPSQLIGRTAVDLLIREAEDDGFRPEQVVFQPELVVRASTTGT